MLTPDEVIWGFRYCLGRNPGGEDVIKAYRHYPDYRSLRDELLNNSEAIRDIVSTVHSTELHPAVHYDRRAVVFIHLQKCGGTTLHNALAAHFSPNRICPERFKETPNNVGIGAGLAAEA